MTTRADLHRLVDELPEVVTKRAALLLGGLRDPALVAMLTAPIDDEQETDEARCAI